MSDFERLSLHEPSIPQALRPYQRDGVQFLLNSRGVLLGDEMGLGKTVQVAVALSQLFRSPSIRKVLIVTPSSLRLNWARELERWTEALSIRVIHGDRTNRAALYRLPIHVSILSYDYLRADIQLLARLPPYDVVVLDEAQRIKNVDSSTSLACRIVPRVRSWALTGTPIENTIDDLGSILRFLMPHSVHNVSPAYLRDILPCVLLRRTKDEVLPDLPPLMLQDVSLELTVSQRVAYDRAWSNRFEAAANGYVHALALITRLKQICNYDPITQASAKLEVLRLIVDQLKPDDRIIVISQYVDTLEWIASQLQSGIHRDIYHGSLNEHQKDSVLDRFETGPGPRMLLLSLHAGGVGLNLQFASHVVLFDRWWNPAVEAQALARAQRFGRSAPLHAFRFLVIDSVEERINEILEQKQTLFDAYFDSGTSSNRKSAAPIELEVVLGIKPISEDASSNR